MADLIEKNKLQNAINKLIYYYDDAGNVCYKVFDVLKALDELPPADTERHAHWVGDEDEMRCSNCGALSGKQYVNIIEEIEYEETNYCHNCGCRMNGGSDGTD